MAATRVSETGAFPVSKLARGCQGVDFREGLVGADSDDAGKAHGEAAGMTVAGGDFVESNLENGVGLHFEVATVLANSSFQKVLREFGNLDIGQTAVSLTNGFQL